MVPFEQQGKEREALLKGLGGTVFGTRSGRRRTAAV
jgi:hypothetical protein